MSKKEFLNLIDKMIDLSDIIIYETKDCNIKYKKKLKKIKKKVERDGIESISKKWG